MTMQEVIFASDLDNTLLFSHKHALADDVCVELLEGKPQGYFTPNTSLYLERIMRRALFVPVTSRSVEQYLRIQFPPSCRPRYAVTTNGAILLVDGQVDPQWRRESEETVAPWQEALEEILKALQGRDQVRHSRIVDGMFAFAACGTPEEAQELAALLSGTTPLDPQMTGRKLYFFPPPINKGDAVLKLRQRFQAEKIICAGDSTMDLPMLRRADLSIVPDPALTEGELLARQAVCPPSQRFYEFVLKEVLEEVCPDESQPESR